MLENLIIAGIILFAAMMVIGLISWMWSLAGGINRVLYPRDTVADLRKALEGAEIRIVQDETQVSDGSDSSDYKDYLRWRRARRQMLHREMEEEMNTSHAPLEQLLRPSGAAGKALRAAEIANIRARRDELARQRDILRALDAQMNPPSPLATLSQREREIARKGN